MASITPRAFLRSSCRFNAAAIRASSRSVYTTARLQAMNSQSAAGEVISETAKAEGGPSKGSLSAQMQSQVDRTQNFQQAAQEVGTRMEVDPANVTSEDAAYLKSREARATGQAQPPADSLSAEAERLASVNEGETKLPSKADLSPGQQSTFDRVENFKQAADEVASKMATKPEYVTKEDAAHLHSREQRAFGETSKEGIASQAQSLASENEKQGTV